MEARIVTLLVAVTWLLPAFAVAQQAQTETWTVPRTAEGHPDLSGTYDTATLTPLQRPRELGNKLFLTAEEAKSE